MTTWGNYDNHIRVGIDWTITPANPGPNDQNVTVTWKFMVGTSASYADPQTLHHNPDGEGPGTTDFYNNLSDGGSKVVYTTKVSYPISRSSGSRSATASLTGVYNGASPSVNAIVQLPDQPASTPGKPTGLSSDSETDHTAHLDWTAPDNGGAAIDHYLVEWSQDSGFPNPRSEQVSGSQDTITGLAQGTRFYWRVSAHNTQGYGPTSSQGTFLTTATATAPTKPGKPGLTNASIDSLIFSWTAASPVPDSYTFEWSTNSTFLTPTDILLDGHVTSYELAGLLDTTTYYVRVKATTGGLDSPWSTGSQGRTLTTNAYDDYGDFATLVDNLAAAVARQMSQIGTYLLRSRSTPLNVPDSTDTFVTFNIAEDVHGQAPSTNDGGQTWTIKQAGLYRIDFGFGWPTFGGLGRLNQDIVVNGNRNPVSGTPRSGRPMHVGGNAVTANTYLVNSTTMRLKAGDTIKGVVWQNTGATLASVNVGDYYAHLTIAQTGV